MALTLPKFIVLKPSDNNGYLSYIREGENNLGFLKFFETQAVSPYTKFEVDISDTNDLVHIKSCQNNKYWQRTKTVSIAGVRPEQCWIAAAAQKKEEDQSKETCTLFKIVPVDHATGTVRIVHVQSGCNLCLWLGSDLIFNRCLSANTREFDSNGYDIFSIIDCKSLLVLPKYVAFKGHNNKYLCVRENYIAFLADDIGDSTVACETFVTDDGKVHIKSICAGKFWGADPKWIWVGYDDPSNNDGTTFRAVKVDDKTIGLINLGNNNFCTTLTGQDDVEWLSPAVPTITKEAKLTVEEPVLTRDIYDVKYDLGNSRVYDETTFIIAKNFASNYTQEPTHMDMKLSYTNIKTSTWKSNFSLKLAMEAKMEFNVPLISQGNIEMSGEFHSDVKWEETKESKTLVDVVHKIVVPAMTKVTVNLIATKGKCDVPFTFMQSDTLYDGTIVTTEVQGATYTGSNYYSIHFETEETKLEPRKKPEPM
ncbi:hypothetical protein CXB51_006476 [Gossypium anomalum]|uniref:Agglutinin domain-containing protein n=1 Tax=Gossypium anomalum TaxID=47600 RepID=A0A8J5ZNB0_9ROSI|nr:hypothetical protein CXB51_006476 [Gossypium anomalum]